MHKPSAGAAYVMAIADVLQQKFPAETSSLERVEFGWNVVERLGQLYFVQENVDNMQHTAVKQVRTSATHETVI